MPQFRSSMLLYTVSLSVWTARRKDKEETAKVNENAGASIGAANVNKALLPDNAELLAVQKWATSFRTWVYATTLPWNDKGARIARVENHLAFMTEAGDRIRQGNLLVDEFMNSYAPAIEAAKFKLNGMFKPNDYPTADQVRRKFVFGIECEAVPDHDDFRAVDGLSDDEIARLIDSSEIAIQGRITAAMGDLYDRLYDVVDRFGTTLVAYDNKEIRKFNDTLVSNITALTDIVPSLNLVEDRKLDELARAAARLATYDLKDLRAMGEVRGAAIREAFALRRKFGRDDTGERAPVEVVQEVASPVIGAGIDAAALASGW